MVFTTRLAKTGPTLVRLNETGRRSRNDLIAAVGVVGRGDDGGRPPLMTAEEGDKNAVAPLAAGWATKLTTPPLTGSIGLLAVTVTASGLANAVPMVAVWGVLPGTT